MQLFSADATIFSKKSPQKPPSKVVQKNSNPLFFLTALSCPNGPNRRNSCSKMCLIDQLYIELGLFQCFLCLVQIFAWRLPEAGKKGRSAKLMQTITSWWSGSPGLGSGLTRYWPGLYVLSRPWKTGFLSHMIWLGFKVVWGIFGQCFGFLWISR